MGENKWIGMVQGWVIFDSYLCLFSWTLLTLPVAGTITFSGKSRPFTLTTSMQLG